MLCALTVRKLKPGTVDQFAEAFVPSDTSNAPAGWVRFTMLRGLADENEVITFGHFDGTLEELEAGQAAEGFEERRASVDQYVESVVVNGVYEVVRQLDI